MNGWTYACLVVGLLLLAAPAGALVSDDITLNTNKPWLTAGSGETATITVEAVNSSDSISEVVVDFAVDSAYGSISPTRVVTDNGTATVTFRHGTLSGTVTVTATVSHEELGEPLTKPVEQRIDHAAPYAVTNLSYEQEVTAGGTTEIVVRMVDEYGNVVNDRNVAEEVSFMVGSPTGGAAFVDDTDEISVPVDAAGNVTATLRVDTVAGENMVLVTFPGDIGWRYLTVTGLANGEPSEIYQSVSPRVEDPNPNYYPELPLDEQFSITYALYDGYGNPAGDRQIKVNVRSISGSLTSGEWFIKTNSMGKAQITYGPSVRAGVAEIVATVVDNSSVSCKQKVGFYSADPTGMVLTAVPQTIASRDVKEDIVSYIKAKIVDSKGNPVRNESVAFRLIGVDDEGCWITDAPWISSGSLTSGVNDTPLVAMTDDEGFAIIDFHPGAFTRNMSDSRYSYMASGSATIRAVWEDKQEDTTVSFRNYPYLSVNVTVEPQVVKVNESVNVTIQLIGDGWALQKRPIDVVLCTDRSGSMLKNTTTDSGYSSRDPEWLEQESVDDRMVHAMRAAKTFVSQMQSSKDRIGLVSFGQDGTANLDSYSSRYWAGNDYVYEYHFKEEWSWKKWDWVITEEWWQWDPDYSDNPGYITEHYINSQDYSGPATRDLGLTSNYKDVNETVEKWLPCGGTPMREGLYESVRMIKENPRTGDPVKAIVLLTDGEYSTNQNPEGGGNNVSLGDGVGRGSVIEYAKRNNIKIFTIALGNEPSHDELQRYANQTCGTFYSATAGDDLTQVYADIATKLQEAAAVNTTMDLAFDNVTINSTPTEDVFEYVYDSEHPPVSTQMVKYWTDNKTTIWGPMCENQSGDWGGDQTLTFNAGDIYLYQTWETTFRLKVLKEGNIDIFGNDSVIHFNGTVGETELGLPHTFITASLNLSETDIGAADMWLTRKSLNTTDDPGILVPSWGLNYTGNRSVTQKIMYQFSQDSIWWDGDWHEVDTLHHLADTNINGTYSTTLNLGEKEGWYKIRVFAQEITPDDDGASKETTWTDPVQVGASDRAYIKIS